MTEKNTQSENKVVDIPFLKLRRRLWIMTAVSSFIGVSLLILRVALYPEVLNAGGMAFNDNRGSYILKVG